MAEAKPKYVIIYASGKAENVNEGKPYHEILSSLYHELCRGGADIDQPASLMKDGEFVVKGDLSTRAWNYGTDMREAYDSATKAVKLKHAPDWNEIIQK